MKMKVKSLLLIKIINVLSLFNTCLNYCDNRSLPIFLPLVNRCVMQYCEEEDFINNIFIKDNNITKIQWINNIIEFGDENCRFTKIATFSTGEMVVFSGSSNPYFYGLNEDGRFLFNEDGKETPYNQLSIGIDFNFPNIPNMGSLIQYDNGEIFVAKLGENEQEYILNFGYKGKFTELYDFENKKIHYKQTSSIFNNKEMKNIRGSIFNLKKSNYFLFSGIFSVSTGFNNYKTCLILYKLYLYNKQSLSGTESIIKEYSENIDAYGNMVSCFQGGSKHIFCFYMHSKSPKQYKIINFYENLSKET